MNLSLSTRLGPIKLRTPVLVASGTFGYGEEFAPYADLRRLGGIIVKSLTLRPRAGNPPPRLVETSSGLLNSIGLQNVGVDAFIADRLPNLLFAEVPIIANVAGTDVEEYEEVCRKLSAAEGVAAVELNISCPNVKQGGMQFGVDPALTEQITARAKKAFGRTMIVKLSPNVSDLSAIARAAEAGGADALSLVNTFLGMAIDAGARKPVLPGPFGGLSGPAIKPLALRCVWQAAEAVKVPILGMGGIMTGEDAVEFLLAGASAVAVGTANLVEPAAALRITKEIEDYMREHRVERIPALVGQARRK